MKHASLGSHARRVAARLRDGVNHQLTSSRLGAPAGSQLLDLREPSLVAWANSISTQTFIPRARAARQECSYVIRPVESNDQLLVAESHARLSDRSKYLRYLGPKPKLSRFELDGLTNVDHHDRETLIAVSRTDGRGIGMAQYVRSATDPRDAEIAIGVIDEWHRQGVAIALMRRLIEEANHAGIDRLTALIAEENVPALALMRRLNLPLTVLGHDEQAFEYRISVGPADTLPLKRMATSCS